MSRKRTHAPHRDAYERWLRQEHPQWSEGSLRLYSRHGARALRAWHEGKTPQQWLASAVTNKTPSPGTLASYRASAGHVWRFLQGNERARKGRKLGPDPKIPARVAAWKRQELSPTPLTPEQLRTFFTVISKTPRVTDYQGRELLLTPNRRTVLFLLPMTGLRISEMCALKVEDVGKQEGQVGLFVERGKGQKTRWVPLSDEARQLLQQYLSWRRRNEGLVDESYLFQGQVSKTKISPQIFRWIVRALDAHMPPWYREMRVRPHTFRHTFVTLLAATGASPKVIADIVGHSSTKTTERYLQPHKATLASAVRAFKLRE